MESCASKQESGMEQDRRSEGGGRTVEDRVQVIKRLGGLFSSILLLDLGHLDQWSCK